MKSVCFAVIVLVCFGLSEQWQQDLEFNDCWNIYYVHDDKSYLLKWSGSDRGSGCKVTFHGYDSSEALDEYKVCIKATKWEVTDPSLRLKYYSDSSVLSDDVKKTYEPYSSDTPETEWCSDSDDYVDVKLTTSGTSASRIELKVYSEKTKDYSNLVGIIVGSVIGGLVLLGIAVTVVIIIACNRRKGMSGTVLTNQNTGGQVISTSTTQAGIQPMAGFQSNAYSSPPPSYNQMTGYTYSGQPQYTGGQMVPNPS